MSKYKAGHFWKWSLRMYDIFMSVDLVISHRKRSGNYSKSLSDETWHPDSLKLILGLSITSSGPVKSRMFTAQALRCWSASFVATVIHRTGLVMYMQRLSREAICSRSDIFYLNGHNMGVWRFICSTKDDHRISLLTSLPCKSQSFGGSLNIWNFILTQENIHSSQAFWSWYPRPDHMFTLQHEYVNSSCKTA